MCRVTYDIAQAVTSTTTSTKSDIITGRCVLNSVLSACFLLTFRVTIFSVILMHAYAFLLFFLFNFKQINDWLID